MRVVLGGDHAGYALKQLSDTFVRQLGHDIVDIGPFGLDPADDYPDFALALGEALLDGRAERGVLICGSGVGASVAVTKLPGIRGAVCHDSFSARQGVEDDDMNVLCLGARVIGPELAYECIRAFLDASFSGAERHLRRLAKVRQIERRQLTPSEIANG
jgi:ribose 5-phosphate isomerase B